MVDSTQWQIHAFRQAAFRPFKKWCGVAKRTTGNCVVMVNAEGDTEQEAIEAARQAAARAK